MIEAVVMKESRLPVSTNGSLAVALNAVRSGPRSGRVAEADKPASGWFAAGCGALLTNRDE
jgi:hypothetical protein